MLPIVTYLDQFYFVERELESRTRLLILLRVCVFGLFLGRSPLLTDQDHTCSLRAITLAAM